MRKAAVAFNGGSKSQIKSQTKSQRPQTRGVTRPRPATIVAGSGHIRPQEATSGDRPNAPYKRGVTGSKPVAPTKFLQLDGLFETLIGDPGNHSREPPVRAP